MRSLKNTNTDGAQVAEVFHQVFIDVSYCEKKRKWVRTKNTLFQYLKGKCCKSF